VRFGGHETFHLREGWLYKGVELLIGEPHKLVDEHVADWLGVGRNMAKSIRHWLLATELAQHPLVSRDSESFEPTELAYLVWEKDRYFLEIGTWWALHINLIHQPRHALAWEWFFNRFRVNRFEKPVCLQAFSRYLDATHARKPSARTLDRDIACLLSSYSRKLPPTSDDPEEALDCPLTELRLLTHHRDTGVYELHLEKKSIPPSILGYAIQRALGGTSKSPSRTTIPFQDIVVGANAPGAVFSLTAEGLFETMLLAESELKGDLKVTGLGSQKVIEFRREKNALQWLRRYYESLRKGRDAA
jgi:hypothetical protein